ncbi:MAG: glycerol-3-phosphate dehydrogenase [Deltaproteobacteria bacterium RIFCSPLOWO2_02_FULL_53_8]|nr:MAG: glycerol-3-phosphate dehydrogenase [Deltaproteobacteria bacterium RIFCSPLOWO2_02_FULL_53_8]
MERITIMGGGSWGTTLANLLAEKGYDVHLWAREEEVFQTITASRENTLFLPNIRLNDNLTPHTDIAEAVTGSSIVLNVVPSHGVRDVFTKAKPFISKDALVVSATKGIEDVTLLTPSGVLKDVLKDMPYRAIAVISGPTFASEVSRRLPAAAVAASDVLDAAQYAQQVFSAPYFRVYASTDVIGVELGGAFKNVIAIASGICDGIGLGANARAALITRGLAEISRLGMKLGANPQTLSGLSGLGDLVLTCTGPLSRNYSTGIAIGRGRSVEQATGGNLTVAEGVKTSKGASALASKTGVEMPITTEVYKVIYESKSPKDAAMELMGRNLRVELEGL